MRFDSGPGIFVRVNRNYVLTEYVLNENDCIANTKNSNAKNANTQNSISPDSDGEDEGCAVRLKKWGNTAQGKNEKELFPSKVCFGQKVVSASHPKRLPPFSTSSSFHFFFVSFLSLIFSPSRKSGMVKIMETGWIFLSCMLNERGKSTKSCQ